MKNLRPHLQRFLALVRRNPRQAAAAAVAIAAAGFIVFDPAPPRAQPAAPAPAAQAPSPPGGTQDAAPTRDIKAIDLTLFPEPAGVRVSNMLVSKETSIPFAADHWAVHVADPGQPATLTWEHTLKQPAAHLAIAATVQLYTPRGLPPLQKISNYAPELEIIADGQIVRPLAPAPWVAGGIKATLQLPQPATRIKTRIVLPPRLQAGYVAITQLKLESW